MLRCGRRGGRMRVIAFIEDTLVARRILEHLGLPARAPTPLPALPPPSPTVDEPPGLDPTSAHPCADLQDAWIDADPLPHPEFTID